MSLLRTSHATAFAIAMSGCVPFALPPLKLEAGGVAAAGDDAPADQGSTSAADGPPVVLRAGVHPQQLIARQGGRVLDVGGGLSVLTRGGTGGDPITGAYGQLGVYPARAAFRGGRLRGGVLATGDWYPDPGMGGGTLALAGEVTGFTRGGFTTEDATGVAFGEWGVGAFAGVGYRATPGLPGFGGTLGLSVRLPLVVGVACCLSPGDVGAARRRAHRHHDAEERQQPPPRHVAHPRMRNDQSDGRSSASPPRPRRGAR